MYDTHNAAEGSIASALEALSGRRGLDYIIDCGINSIENAHRAACGRLNNTIKLIGEAVKRGDFALAEEIYDEFCAD